MSPHARPVDPWAWPADTPVERAQRVARSYRQQLADRLPDVCRALDRRMAQLGQDWVVPRREGELQLDEPLTIRQAASFAKVQPGTIVKWRQRGLVVTQTPDGPRVTVRALLEYRARQRLRRLRGKQAADRC